jgi:hypothetical protein
MRSPVTLLVSFLFSFFVVISQPKKLETGPQVRQQQPHPLACIHNQKLVQNQRLFDPQWQWQSTHYQIYTSCIYPNQFMYNLPIVPRGHASNPRWYMKSYVRSQLQKIETGPQVRQQQPHPLACIHNQKSVQNQRLFDPQWQRQSTHYQIYTSCICPNQFVYNLPIVPRPHCL